MPIKPAKFKYLQKFKFKSRKTSSTQHTAHVVRPAYIIIIVRLVHLLYVRYFIHTYHCALLSQHTDSHATAMHTLRCIGCRGRCIELQKGAGVSYAHPYIRHGEMFCRHAFSLTKRVKLHLSPTVGL